MLFVFFCSALLLLLTVEHAKALSFVGGTEYASEGVTDDAQTVLLGALFPFHGQGMERTSPCGNLRRSNVQLSESMVFAIETINNDSSLLPNVSLAFNIRDTCTSVNYALQQSVGYIQSVSNSACDVNGTLGVTGVVGTSLSTISQATTNLFGLFEIPQVSYGATSPSLSSNQFRYFFRTIPSDKFQAQAMADVIVYFKWDYIVLLHSEDLYGVDGANALRAELEAKNGSTCIATQISLSRSPPNYEEAVDEMSQVWVKNASVVVLFGHREDAVSIFQVIQSRQANNDSFDLTNITWIASDSWSVAVPRMFHSLAKGMLGLFPATMRIPAFDSYLSSLTLSNNARNPWFVELWESQFNCSLGNTPGLPNCTSTNRSLNFPPARQVPLVLDAVYALAHSLDSLIKAKCPNGTLCSEITVSGGAVNGSMLRDHLLNISFDSTFQGRVSFDDMGDIPQASYSISNLQKDNNSSRFMFRNVGLWSDGTINITGNVEWVTGQPVPPPSICSEPCKPNEVRRVVPEQTSCCFTCEACDENTVSKNGECMRCRLGTVPSPNRTMCELLPLTFLSWSSPWGLIIIIFTSIGIIATATVTAIFVIFYKHEIIRASSRELSAILLFGIFLCYVVPFFYISEPSPAICGVQRFSIGFCFAISYSALLVKTQRIHRIFNRSPSSMNTPLRFISPVSQVVFTLCLVGVQVLISVVWLIAEPPKTLIVETMNSRELQCGSNPYIGFSVFLGYNLILLILSTYFAFRTRKVPANFNEAKFINITLYTICIIWLAFLPIHFATIGLGNLFRTLTLVLGVIFSAGTTLGCLFVSKVYILLTRVKKDKKIESMSKSEAAKVQSLSASLKM